MLPVLVKENLNKNQLFNGFYRISFLKNKMKKLIIDLERTEGYIKTLRKEMIHKKSSSCFMEF